MPCGGGLKMAAFPQHPTGHHQNPRDVNHQANEDNRSGNYYFS
jgi:hypothetical protein